MKPPRSGMRLAVRGSGRCTACARGGSESLECKLSLDWQAWFYHFLDLEVAP
jgi:hypothetical protein